MRYSFSLLEMIASLAIISVLAISVLNLNLLLYKDNSLKYNTTILKIDLEATRLFLEKKIATDTQLEKLNLKENSLYYNDNLLLNQVSNYEKNIQNNIVKLNICVKNNIEICNTIYLKTSN